MPDSIPSGHLQQNTQHYSHMTRRTKRTFSVFNMSERYGDSLCLLAAVRHVVNVGGANVVIAAVHEEGGAR